MKSICFLILIFILFPILSSQEKTDKSEKPPVPTKVEDKVNPKLDPIYFAANYDDVLSKRKPMFRLRKGDVPEQIWRIKTNGTVMSAPILFESKLLIGTSMGGLYCLDFKSGEADKKFCNAQGMVVWTAVQNNNRATAMTWVGTVVSYAKDWEHFMQTCFSAYKSKEIRPLGALVWGAGSIITRRDNYPVMIDSKEDKILAQPNRAWPGGEATAPLINAGAAFWIGTSKSELVSFDTNLTTVLSVIKLEKSYATALGSENSLLFALTESKELMAYDTTNNTLKWKINVAGYGVNSMVCEGGYIYLNAGSFYVIDNQDGKILLERKSMSFEGFMRTKPLITKDRIFSCDSEGNMYIFNKKDYAMIQAINLEEDVMVNFYYQDKVLYVATIAGYLYALDVSLY